MPRNFHSKINSKKSFLRLGGVLPLMCTVSESKLKTNIQSDEKDKYNKQTTNNKNIIN